jgi:hypothetical protein
LKGWHCFDATDIKNATEELKRLPQNGVQEFFQHFYSRGQPFMFVKGECFPGNVA